MDALVDPDKLLRLYHRYMQEATVQPPHVQQIEERPQKGSVEMSVPRRSHPQPAEDEKNEQDDNADPEVFHDRILHGSMSAKHRVNPMEQGGDLVWVLGSPTRNPSRHNTHLLHNRDTWDPCPRGLCTCGDSLHKSYRELAGRTALDGCGDSGRNGGFTTLHRSSGHYRRSGHRCGDIDGLRHRRAHAVKLGKYCGGIRSIEVVRAGLAIVATIWCTA